MVKSTAFENLKHRSSSVPVLSNSPVSARGPGLQLSFVSGHCSDSGNQHVPAHSLSLSLHDQGQIPTQYHLLHT